jgi:hypothetical protein
MIENLLLFLAGIAGILAVNLIEIDALNQTNDGNTSLQAYCRRHWANMALSVVMVAASVIAKNVVAALEATGNSAFIGVFTIGMVGPTVAQFIRSKALVFLRAKTPPAEN